MRRFRGENPDSFLEPTTEPPASYETSLSAEIKELAKKHGGAKLFLLKVLRLLGCILFLSLSIYTAVLDEESRRVVTNGKRKKERHSLSWRELQDLGMCMASVSSSLFTHC